MRAAESPLCGGSRANSVNIKSMKRIYLILSAAIGLAGTFQAAGEGLSLERITPEALSKGAKTLPHRISATAPADATWEEAGRGMWKEALLDKLIPTGAVGSAWEVTLEQAKEYPGYYRVLPYREGSPIAEMLGQADNENYVYINATNPERVYIEQFFAFGHILVADLVPENGWKSDSQYGTLRDGCITFPTKSFAYATYDAGQYDYCNIKEYFQIALPGSELKDYLFEVDMPACDDNGEMTVSVTAGEDIAKVKMISSPGYFASSANNDRAVALQGADFDLAKGYMAYAPGDNAPTGLYSTIAVALSADNAIVGSRCVYSHLGERDNSDWAPAGTARMNEAILTTVYETATPQILTCETEQSVSQPGRYRLKNPYAGHAFAQSYDDFVINHEHDHYIYINATDPAKVYIEASPLGINSEGEAMIYSQAGLYVDRGQSATAAQNGLFGRLAEEEGETIITMPDGSLMFAEKEYDNGEYHFNIGQDFIVVISPGQGAVEEIDATGETYAPAEYFNLQGIRVANPRAGELVIERRGSKVTKTIIK